jgi:ATP-dependent exoDNAse (exonuclease V) alpha subunit
VGKLTPEDVALLKTRVKTNMEPGDPLLARTIKFMPLNRDVDDLNRSELNKLPGKEWEFAADDKEEKTKTTKLRNQTVIEARDPDETLFNKLFVVDKLLTLKPNARVMLRANIDVENGLTNGSIGNIVEMIQSPDGETLIRVKIGNEEHDIQPFVFMDEDWEDDCLVTRSRKQYPLSLAYATSIHKSQSLTFSEIEIDIGHSIFTAGQSYVALSRVKSVEGLVLRSFTPKKVFADPVALKFEKSISEIATYI